MVNFSKPKYDYYFDDCKKDTVKLNTILNCGDGTTKKERELLMNAVGNPDKMQKILRRILNGENNNTDNKRSP